MYIYVYIDTHIYIILRYIHKFNIYNFYKGKIFTLYFAISFIGMCILIPITINTFDNLGMFYKITFILGFSINY